MQRNVSQNKRLHGLIGSLSLSKEQKEELVYQFTGERTISSKEMHADECQNLINYLNVQYGEIKRLNNSDPADKMRKKILSRCHEMKWTINGQIDWQKLNNWLNKYGYLHKGLMEYTIDELPKLLTQFDNLLKAYYAKG